MSFTGRLAAFAAETPTATLPRTVLDQGRRITLDTLGVAVGAASLEPARILLDEIESWGGASEASILVRGSRTSAVQAAYANGYLASLLDADETFLNYAHIANAIVPATLAVAERVGASGRDVLAAVAVGFEVAGRIGLSYRMWRLVDGKPEWTAVAGYSWVVFGVAAAAGRLLKLDRRQMASAFGIAGYATPAPTIGKWLDSTGLPHTKYVFVGPLAHAGVSAALLAACGFEGDDDVLDGEQGFWRISGSDWCDWDSLVAGLGSEWRMEETSFKLYPACRFLHGPLDLFKQMLEDRPCEPAEIRRLVVRMPPAATRAYFVNPSPANVVEGTFSVPHAFACLAHRLPLGPAWHTREALGRADLADFRQRVVVEVDPTAAPAIVEQITAGPGVSFYRRCPSSIRVETDNGVFEAEVEYASGDPWGADTALDDAALDAKARSYMTPVLGAQGAEAAIRALRGLEDVPDVRRMVGALSGSA
jgi:2-methylcitrate dehydratase PrpD